MRKLTEKCPFCPKEFEADSEQLYWHIKIHNATIEGIKQPEVHEHSYVPKQYIGTWSASIPPPTLFCTKCGNWA